VDAVATTPFTPRPPRPSCRPGRVGPARAAAVLGAVLTVAALSACSSKPVDRTVAVEGSDTACTPAQTSVQAGVIAFTFSNSGTKENELYVLRENGDVVGEREGVGPGTTAELVVEVEAGSYRLTCKPGQQGDGISTPITVTG
jgi:iron uptake system component EfeO